MASPKNQHRAGARNKASSSSRRRQRPLLLRRAMLHSCLCFLLGLFTGLAPSDWTDAASRAAATANAAATGHVFRALHAINRHHHQVQQQASASPPPQQPQVLVVVTTTALSERERRSAGLTRTAHALRLVSEPVVWLVVEAAREAAPTARLLRGTGVVYRHLTFNSSLSSEAGGGGNYRRSRDEEERNVALGHIEQHRLRGVVLFGGLADVYDLRVLHHLRHVRTLGAWPVATVWEKRVAVEGPVVSSSLVVTGWFSSDGDATRSTRMSPRPPLADVDAHGFAFSSDLLWDPARWDRFPTSEPDQSQDSIKFVQRLIVEEYKSARAILPDNSSQILVWRVDATLLWIYQHGLAPSIV